MCIVPWGTSVDVGLNGLHLQKTCFRSAGRLHAMRWRSLAPQHLQSMAELLVGSALGVANGQCSLQASRCGLPSCSMPPVSSGCSQLHQQVLCSTGHHTGQSLGSEDTARTPPGAP